MNMFSLNNISFLESPTILGRERLAFIYFASGIGGSLVSYVMCPNPSLGASGAIMGLLGAAWMYCNQNERVLGSGARTFRESIQKSCVLTLCIGLTLPMIDNWCALWQALLDVSSVVPAHAAHGYASGALATGRRHCQPQPWMRTLFALELQVTMV